MRGARGHSPLAGRPRAALLAGCAAVLVALLAGCAAAPAPAAGPATAAAACTLPAQPMRRVELLFGATRQDGQRIDDTEWAHFLEAEVTPRFPDGLTAFDAYGQWRRPDGVVARLPSRMLLIWYVPAPDASARIDAIREAFKLRYAQFSVLRVDGTDCVSF